MPSNRSRSLTFSMSSTIHCLHYHTTSGFFIFSLDEKLLSEVDPWARVGLQGSLLVGLKLLWFEVDLVSSTAGKSAC